MLKCPQHQFVDLHGMSEKQAELMVKYHLSSAKRNGNKKIRFVTGRGNHVNSKGQRGTLFKRFESWIGSSACSNVIQRLEKHDGYFEVYFKSNPNEAQLQAFHEKLSQSYVNDLKLLADQGVPAIQCLYAAALREGSIVAKNDKAAFKYDKLAAKAGHSYSMFHLAYCYLHGIGTRLNDLEANKWFAAADKAGIAEATVCLGDSYRYGRSVASDGKKAASFYARAAGAGNIRAMRNLGNAYMTGGLDLEKNPSKSFTWYLKAAKLSDPASEYNVGCQYMNGVGVAKNESKALKYLERSAEHGDPDAQYVCGRSYYFGKYVTKNQTKGIAWLKQAAKNGSEAASALLIKIDPDSADEHVKKAAERGNIIAKLGAPGEQVSDLELSKVIADALQQARTMKIDDIMFLDNTSRYFLIDEMILSKQKKLLKKAMLVLDELKEQNDPFSIRRLINLGRNLQLCVKTDKEIIQLLQHGVQVNDSKCMIILGYYYQLGILVDVSQEQAANLYQQAASLDNPVAYLMLSQHQFFTAGAITSALLDTVASLLEKAINLEKSDEVTSELSSGIMDCYVPVSSIAKRFLSKIRAFVDEQSVETFFDFFEKEVTPVIHEIVFNRPTNSKKSDKQQVKPLFKDALELKKQGNALAGQRKYRLALEKYTLSIKADPKVAQVWLNKGLMHKKLGDYEDALDAINTALRLEPAYFKAKFNKAEVLNVLQRYNDALPIYNQLSIARPKNVAVQKRIESIQKQVMSSSTESGAPVLK